MSVFTKAEKKQAKLRLAITGPSGSGKTFSALLLAAGIGKKIALIDTENHSASLYAGEKDIPEFDTLEIEPPYTIEKYIEAIKAAVDGKYDVLVIDGITHAWAGEGGLLSQKEAMDGTGRGNSYTNWATITKKHEEFKAWLLKVDIHLIATMRSKQDYVLETNDKGKSVPRKVGLAPIQREGMEYEFTVVFDMAMNHHASVSKTRCNAFDGRLFKPSKKEGKELSTWLLEGKEAEPVKLPEQKSDILEQELYEEKLATARKAFVDLGIPAEEIDEYIETLPFSDDTKAVYSHFVELYKKNAKDKEKLKDVFKTIAAKAA